jgi:hypothetical protein
VRDTQSVFSDADLTNFVATWYGFQMAEKVEEIFDLAPVGTSGFADSVRRSLTRDYDRKIQEDDRA